MKIVLRGLTWKDDAEKNEAKINFKEVRQDRFLDLRRTESVILEFLTTFYGTHGEAPSIKVIYDHFEAANQPEEIGLVEELTAVDLYSGASFVESVEREVEKQAAANLARECRAAMEIASQGKTTKNVLIKGTAAAIEHLVSSMRIPPAKEDEYLPSGMKEGAVKLTQLYEERKADPNTYGVPSGYGLIDSSTAGLRKKQLYLHAGYAGHLKSTIMLNMIVNAAVDGGYNSLVFTSEMAKADLMFILTAIHSANPKFNGVANPISAKRLMLGALGQAEEDFYKEVLDDLVNNSMHGSVRVVDSGEFTTFSSVMQRTVQEHQRQEVDILWVDYLTRLPLDAKYLRWTVTEARNETIADAKRFAMAFDQGKGLPVCSPFQINREGFKKARDQEGKMNLTALAQYNAAEREADIITYTFYDAEQKATCEPVLGVLKSRYGDTSYEPVKLVIEPDSRRVFDMASGMAISASIPTQAASAPDEVEI